MNVQNFQINVSDQEGNTCLTYAAKEGHVSVVRLLLKHGADPDRANSYGWTPTMQVTDPNRFQLFVELVVDSTFIIFSMIGCRFGIDSANVSLLVTSIAATVTSYLAVDLSQRTILDKKLLLQLGVKRSKLE
jgi:ankyrin repeat protein